MAMPAPSPVGGTARVQTLVDAFPDHLSEGFLRGSKASLKTLEGAPILAIGMGGSGIAGELLANLATLHGSSPLLSVRDFALPRWADGSTPCVFTSYSGNTAETLDAYAQARKRGLPRAVITSGGTLAEQGRKDGIPVIEVPSGLPPRCSTGYLFGALYGLLRSSLPGLPKDLTGTVEALKASRHGLTTADGPVAHVLDAWGDRNLWTYVPDRWAAVGRRWKTQSEENSKVLSHFDTVPELMHNAIVSWDVLPKAPAQPRSVVFLTGPGESSVMARRLSYMAEVVRATGTPVVTVATKQGEPVAEMLEAVWIGDLASVAHAAARGVDAETVAVIEKMKAALAAPTSPA